MFAFPRHASIVLLHASIGAVTPTSPVQGSRQMLRGLGGRLLIRFVSGEFRLAVPLRLETGRRYLTEPEREGFL